jgi:hypothetical protein
MDDDNRLILMKEAAELLATLEKVRNPKATLQGRSMTDEERNRLIEALHEDCEKILADI